MNERILTLFTKWYMYFDWLIKIGVDKAWLDWLLLTAVAPIREYLLFVSQVPSSSKGKGQSHEKHLIRNLAGKIPRRSRRYKRTKQMRNNGLFSYGYQVKAGVVLNGRAAQKISTISSWPWATQEHGVNRLVKDIPTNLQINCSPALGMPRKNPFWYRARNLAN